MHVIYIHKMCRLKQWVGNRRVSTVVGNQQTLLTFTFIHFGKPLHHKGKKTHVIVFTGQTFHLQLVIGQMLISHLWEKPSNLSEFVQSITNQFFFQI